MLTPVYLSQTSANCSLRVSLFCLFLSSGNVTDSPCQQQSFYLVSSLAIWSADDSSGWRDHFAIATFL